MTQSFQLLVGALGTRKLTSTQSFQLLVPLGLARTQSFQLSIPLGLSRTQVISATTVIPRTHWDSRDLSHFSYWYAWDSRGLSHSAPGTRALGNSRPVLLEKVFGTQPSSLSPPLSTVVTAATSVLLLLVCRLHSSRAQNVNFEVLVLSSYFLFY